MNALPRNVLYALRKLTKSPGFTFLAVLTLALGIGLNSAVFSVVNAILFRPLPVAAPEELVNVYTEEQAGFITHAPMAFPDYVDFAEGSRSLAGLAAYTSSGLVLEHGEQSEGILAELVSGNYFDLLGVPAAAGRTFAEAEDRPGDPRFVAVLSHGAWQRRFGADEGAVGRELRLNGRPFTVIGVADESFSGMMRGIAPEVWIPIRTSSAIHAGSISNSGTPTEGLDRIDDRGRRWHFVVGRLAEGATVEQAAAEVATIGARLRQEYPDSNDKRSFAVLATDEVRFFPGFDRVISAGSFVVLGVVALVLLIACANLANMLLARAVARRKEMATRLALGASRGAVVRQLLAESLTLALAGGGVGLLLAVASNAAIDRVSLPLPVDLHLGLALDLRVVLFTLGLATVAAVAFGLAPAFEATRTDLVSALTDETRGSSAGRGKRRLRDALVVGQVALSLVLLICAGLAVRSMGNAHRIDPGFDPQGLVVARVSPESQGYTEPQSQEFFRRLGERLSARPEVRSVGFTGHLPLTFNISMIGAAAEGRDTVPPEEWPIVDTASVGPDYLETMGIEVLRGRSFSEWDDAGSARVAVINETAAARLWPGDDAVGRRLRIEDYDDYLEVVGVARDGKYRTLGEEPRPFLYQAVAQDWKSSQVAVVRIDGDRPQALAAIRGEIRGLDADLAVGQLATIEDATASALVLPRLGAALFGLFGVIGLVLAMTGIYGVVSYLVSQRTHEIGIRMAMGARRLDILRLVVGQGLGLTVAGVALGLAAAFAVTRVLSVMLYGISATDAVTFVAVPLVLTLVALLATVIPARRASRLDPLAALHYE